MSSGVFPINELLNSVSGFVINGDNNFGSSVSRAGDVNYDGVDDIIIGMEQPNNPTANFLSKAYVVYGHRDLFGSFFKAFPASWNISSLNTIKNVNGVTIMLGSNATALNSWSVSGGGDINGDGYTDIVIGSNVYNNGQGVSTVICGSGNLPQIIYPETLDGYTGFRVFGRDLGHSGDSVSIKGDYNGDGLDDILIGSPYSNSTDGTPNVGQVYFIFGNSTGFPAQIQASTLNGQYGAIFNGVNPGDICGLPVKGIGDLNGDGLNDFIIGCWGRNGREGVSYVVFGNNEIGKSIFNLSSINGTNGFAISGINVGDRLGFPSTKASDINHDGISDIILGATGYNNFTGEIYVLFGSRTQFSPNFDLKTLNGKNGFTIVNDLGGTQEVWMANGIGDFNGDGIDDFAVTTGTKNANESSKVIVIYGRESFPSYISLSYMVNCNGGFIIDDLTPGVLAPTPDDSNWISVDGMDINKDGYSDLIIGDGWAKSATGVGQAYVIYGNPFYCNAVGNIEAVGNTEDILV